MPESESSSASFLDGIATLDEACGAGVVGDDLTHAEYATIIEEAVRLLEPMDDLAIPAADIDTVCEVRAGREKRKEY